jgi:DNA polymerase-3 subunit gamma/tau
MQYQVLANKWRPKIFSDLFGQRPTVDYFQKAITQNQLAHAYLFTGTRGIGKTSLARIVAKAVNCQNFQGEPCLKCAACMEIETGNSIDFQEIDGASNNSVENIRSLNDNLKYLPVNLKYKIYVIDEVHMLSTSAFNALLKSIEEPPEYVIFMFATTEPEKVPDTVKSRCQKMDLQALSATDLENYLEKIAQKEALVFENEELKKLISAQGRGSIRDMLSFLEMLKVMGEGKIQQQHVKQILGILDQKSMNALMKAVLIGDIKQVSAIYQQILTGHVDLSWFVEQVLNSFYELSVHPGKKFEQLELSPDDFALEEIYWMYENLAKELDWAIKSVFPIQTVELILHKIGLRRTFFDQKKTHPVELKENHIEQTNIETKEAVKKRAPIQFEWDQFLNQYKYSNPIPYSYLERGNIISHHIDQEMRTIELIVGFKESSKVFYDFFQDADANKNLKNYLINTYDADGVNLKWECLAQDDPRLEGFVSLYEIAEDEKRKLDENCRDEIINHNNIKSAEKIFNVKIDKVILNETRMEQ